jgi:hypothetical protein
LFIQALAIQNEAFKTSQIGIAKIQSQFKNGQMAIKDEYITTFAAALHNAPN